MIMSEYICPVCNKKYYEEDKDAVYVPRNNRCPDCLGKNWYDINLMVGNIKVVNNHKEATR